MISPMMVLRRREFLAGAAASVLLSGQAIGPAGRIGRPIAKLNAWVRISPDNVVTLSVSQSEMGQGISTTLPLVLADELGAARAQLRFEWADYDPAYEHPGYHWMFTGNSESSSAFFDVMRKMGAAAREMLIAAAARRLKVDRTHVAVRDGKLFATDGRILTFGAVAADAAKMPVPKNPALKDYEKLTFVGRPQPRVDVPSKTDGSAIFGIDVHVPGMLVAALRRCPVQGGTLKSWPAGLARMPGVLAVVEVPGGLAVVSERWWTAKRALDDAELVWDEGPSASYSSDQERQKFVDLLKDGAFDSKAKVGDAGAAIAKALDGRRLTVVYELPLQAHATMEPMNCTAHVTPTSCELWAPTQGVEMAHFVAKQLTNLPDAAIKINRTYLGGGFGRRLLADFIKLSIIVAQKVGRPVKLVWSREEDFRYDAYRPPMLHAVDAALSELPAGAPAIAHRIVSPSHMLYIMPRPALGITTNWSAPAAPPAAYDVMAVEGVVDAPYGFSDLSVEQHLVKTDLAVSVWRTTGHGPNNFVLESVIDELAHLAGIDPLAYRRGLLGKDARALAVLEFVAEKGSWGRPSEGRVQGLALAKAFGGYIAQVAEISVNDKAVKVHRIVSAVDCGRTLDPGIAASNIEGGVVWGLSGMRTAMTFSNGVADQSNFDAFDPIHLWETPSIETHFIESGNKLGGTGELGPVPVHAAVCNAIFGATGERIRNLPLSRSGYRFV